MIAPAVTSAASAATNSGYGWSCSSGTSNYWSWNGYRYTRASYAICTVTSYYGVYNCRVGYSNGQLVPSRTYNGCSNGYKSGTYVGGRLVIDQHGRII